MDLRRAEIDAWMDTKCLLPGQRWKREITRAIQNAAYFIALISEKSLNKRGFVQSEMKRALEVLSEIPNDQIFLIPARLDGSIPADEELENLNWVDLFPDYRPGLDRILAIFSNLEREPLAYVIPTRPDAKPAIPDVSRAPIQYTPYRSFSDFAGDLFARLPDSVDFTDLAHPVHVTYATNVPGVILPAYLREKYPEEITIVLQFQFRQLKAQHDHVSVILWFNKRTERLVIPYASIKEVVFTEIGLRIEQFGR